MVGLVIGYVNRSRYRHTLRSSSLAVRSMSVALLARLNDAFSVAPWTTERKARAYHPQDEEGAGNCPNDDASKRTAGEIDTSTRASFAFPYDGDCGGLAFDEGGWFVLKCGRSRQ